MLASNAPKAALAAAQRDPRGIVRGFGNQNTSARTTKPTIIATLIGSTRCEAIGYVTTGHAPIFKACRLLLQAGHNPNAELRAYRGGVLAIKVRSIGKGAALTVEDGASGRPQLKKIRPERQCAASYRHSNGGGGI